MKVKNTSGNTTILSAIGHAGNLIIEPGQIVEISEDRLSKYLPEDIKHLRPAHEKGAPAAEPVKGPAMEPPPPSKPHPAPGLEEGDAKPEGYDAMSAEEKAESDRILAMLKQG